MKKLLLVLSVATLIFASCAPRVYKANDFDRKTASHKIVAILPAEVDITLRPNEMKKITVGQLKETEEKTGFGIQDKMYAWFLRRSGKYRYTVTFQDISKTNALLLQRGIKYGDMRGKTKEELARLLGVDAVISTRAIMKKPMSDGAAVAFGVLFGAWGNTNDVQTSITITDAAKGDLMWKYDYQASGSIGSNTDNLVNGLMRNASKKFPYNDK
jgi:hypothetical protein